VRAKFLSSVSRSLHSTRRIRNLESHVADIRQSQTTIQNTLVEIVNHLRAGSANMIRSPSAFPPTYMHASPNVHADSPASMSTPVSARPPLDTGPVMSTSQPGSTVCLPAPQNGPVLLTLLNRCILVLLRPLCGPTAMDKHLRYPKEVTHINRSPLNIICLLVSILRCHHYLGWNKPVLLALRRIICLR
jgi:hypothetical protein